MIAELPETHVQEHLHKDAPSDASSSALSVSGVVGMLQIVLATRRAARSTSPAPAPTEQITPERPIARWHELVSWDALAFNGADQALN